MLEEENSLKNVSYSGETKRGACVSFTDFSFWGLFGFFYFIFPLHSSLLTCCFITSSSKTLLLPEAACFRCGKRRRTGMVAWANTATPGSFPSGLMVTGAFMCTEQPAGALCLAGPFRALPVAYSWEIWICWQLSFWGFASSVRGKTPSERWRAVAVLFIIWAVA